MRFFIISLSLVVFFTMNIQAEAEVRLNSGDSDNSSVLNKGMKYYVIHAQKGETLEVTLTGILGDADLYVKVASLPTNIAYDKESDNSPSLDERCVIQVSQDTDIYIGVYGYNAADYTVNVSLSIAEDEVLVSKVPVSSSVTLHEMKYYKIVGRKNDVLEVTLTNVQGDADLYLKVAAHPTTSNYDRESDNAPNMDEKSIITLNQDGTVYIGVYGYQIANYTLTATLSGDIEEVSSMLYEDAEDSSISRWEIIDNQPVGASVSNIFDNEKNTRVIKFDNGSLAESDTNAYRLGGAWNNRKHFNAKWDMKTNAEYIIDIVVNTNNGERTLRYSDYYEDYTSIEGELLVYGLGKASIDGKWHTFYRDLENDLITAEPANRMVSVESFIVRANGSFDNIELYSSPNKVYENAEDGLTSRWRIYRGDNANSIININDNIKNSRVISLQGLDYSHQYIIGDFVNGNDSWNNTKHKNIKWSMKYTSDCIIQINVNTTKGERYMEYLNADIASKRIDGNEIIYGLGTNIANGKWHTFIRDIAADIKAVEPDNQLLSVEGLLVLGSTQIDDLELFSVSYPSARHKAGLSLTFDDTDVTGWFSLRNMFLKYKVKPTFFVSYFDDFSADELSKLKTLEQDGAEVGCHTYSHGGIERDFNNDSNRIEEYINTQIKPAYNSMKAAGFNPKSFAHPYGETHKDFDHALRNYFPYLRGLSEARGRLVQRDNIFFKQGNPFNMLVATTIDNGYRNIEEIREAMIRARENGEILSLYGHHIKNDYNTLYIVQAGELEKILIMANEIGLISYTYAETYVAGQ